MTEAFQVIFNSQGSNVINNTSLNAVQYSVNWTSFLPLKYKRFRCQFIFKSIRVASALTDFGYVNMDIGKVYINDGLSMLSNFGVINPNYFTSTSSFYAAASNDNNEFYIDFPINRTPTIYLKTFAGANMANMPHYTLILNLIGIEED